ncbi:MAG: EF-P beta-lysylation protein EpmB [Planctomycetota bacterium]|nr:MAG: EF-P beta-lysylation protein EpmB [Planctomycetota bacterium]
MRGRDASRKETFRGSYRVDIVTVSRERVAGDCGVSARGWQASLKSAIRDGRELLERLELAAHWDPAALAAAAQFPTFVPLEFLARMQPGDPDDPLLRQVLPVAEELDVPPGFSHDPLQEAAATVTAGLLQKYDGRALLVTGGACAVHCRYCFRRHFPYEELPGSSAAWEGALRQIAADRSLSEVILSGGDPLMLTDVPLARLVERIASIEHVRRLRVHTRLPIVIPGRVTDALVDMLVGAGPLPVMVVHVNHAAEIDREVEAALTRLADAGVLLLNQAVLLRGVNDDVDALAELSLRLLDLRVVPYYLHQLDRTAGTAHFEVSPQQGVALVGQLRARLPGYAVPRYVEEVPGAAGKMMLA